MEATVAAKLVVQWAAQTLLVSPQTLKSLERYFNRIKAI